eukprot:TRINITY_DN388_c0_g1_i1.p1 TRINITY_DN388_c0_g1~~TRINITY_DN388_c0_g1_i1.p1  ORF type:complete len:424 (-),score=136.36 TRINITY_DN388_c0_g1_i1:220-1470(-)
MSGYSVTCTAPVNIAVIKYWGKRDVKLNLPLNGSISGTLNQRDLKTTTKITISESFKEDKMELNGKEESLENPRVQTVLKEMRKLAKPYENNKTGEMIDPNWNIRIETSNNFPTAAGLASSASGYACLVYTLGMLFNILPQGEINDDNREEYNEVLTRLSEIARRGSGSSSRSLFGGFVRWDVGIKEDGSDSIAYPIVDETFWDDIEILVLVVSKEKKKIGSTVGMQTSVATSPLMEDRLNNIVQQRMIEMENAIKEKDFENFANITMVDSDDFHEICHTTDPPIYYLNDISKFIIQLVNSFNEKFGINVAYTFDAGPNAVLYLKRSHLDLLLKAIYHYIPFTSNDDDNNNNNNNNNDSSILTKDDELLSRVNNINQQEITFDNLQPLPSDSVQYIIHTNVGPGPQIIDPLSKHDL